VSRRSRLNIDFVLNRSAPLRCLLERVEDTRLTVFRLKSRTRVLVVDGGKRILVFRLCQNSLLDQSIQRQGIGDVLTILIGILLILF
jgi:hypothetical protein